MTSATRIGGSGRERPAWLCLLLAAVGLACGGRSNESRGTPGSGAGVVGSGGRATEGEAGAGRGDGGSAGAVVPAGGTSGVTAGEGGGNGGSAATIGASGCATAPDLGGTGGSTPQDTCDVYALEHAIELVTVGRGECFLYYPPPPGNGTDILHGLIVFDHAGHLIDAFGPMGDQKQQLLASVAEERWPCYADETLGYTCKGLGH